MVHLNQTQDLPKFSPQMKEREKERAQHQKEMRYGKKTSRKFCFSKEEEGQRSDRRQRKSYSSSMGLRSGREIERKRNGIETLKGK